jgi:hypothetical protein
LEQSTYKDLTHCGIVPYDITEFRIDQQAIAFAGNVVERYIKTEDFGECLEAPQGEFSR